MTMKRILFDGALGEKYPEGIQVAATTAREALSGLRLHAGFVPGTDRMLRIRLPDFPTPASLNSPTEMQDIRVSLVEDIAEVAGAGGKIGSIFSIVIGVLLVIYAAPLAGFIGMGATATAVGYAGLLMAAQGLMGLLAKKPKTGSYSSASSERSNIMGSTGNTVRSNTFIPLVLGRSVVYGHFLSYQVTAAQKGTEITVPPAEIQGGQFFAADDTFTLTEEEWE